ncbi:hypothetical protein RLJV_23910 [Pseudomonas aeruginosa]|nr:hypothetical protein RLJV_23910 [Pseudomonas aeruginosa]
MALSRRMIASSVSSACRLQRLVEDLHLVVLLHGRRDAAHHQDGLVLGRLVHLHHLETPGQRRLRR